MSGAVGAERAERSRSVLSRIRPDDAAPLGSRRAELARTRNSAPPRASGAPPAALASRRRHRLCRPETTQRREPLLAAPSGRLASAGCRKPPPRAGRRSRSSARPRSAAPGGSTQDSTCSRSPARRALRRLRAVAGARRSRRSSLAPGAVQVAAAPARARGERARRSAQRWRVDRAPRPNPSQARASARARRQSRASAGAAREASAQTARTPPPLETSSASAAAGAPALGPDPRAGLVALRRDLGGRAVGVGGRARPRSAATTRRRRTRRRAALLGLGVLERVELAQHDPRLDRAVPVVDLEPHRGVDRVLVARRRGWSGRRRRRAPGGRRCGG